MQEFRLYANYIKRRIIKKRTIVMKHCVSNHHGFIQIYSLLIILFWGVGGHNPTERKLWKILNR